MFCAKTPSRRPLQRARSDARVQYWQAMHQGRQNQLVEDNPKPQNGENLRQRTDANLQKRNKRNPIKKEK